jgi:PadR family transcriptional regulator, regulatory protein AphA
MTMEPAEEPLGKKGREADRDTVRRIRGAAEPARYTLLALLLHGPHHGYDLARAFAAESTLGAVIRLTMSHLYTLLSGLEREGLIVGEAQSAGARPRRRVYWLTDAGREAVHAWLREPVPHLRDLRLEFLLKLYFARLLDPEIAGALIEGQREIVQRLIDEMERADVRPRPGVDNAFVALVRSSRLSRARAALEWLEGDVAALPPVRDEA